MSKKTVLITGCSAGGIGSSLAETFLAEGYHVFATARNVDRMDHLKGKTNLTLLKLDVTDKEQVVAAVEAVRLHGRLDCLVNNSGQGFPYPILDGDIDGAKSMFDTNVWGALRMIQAFAPLLIESKGQIVNICSAAGHLNIPWMSLYAASKISLELLGETLRLELSPFGVRVLNVVTGAVASAYAANFADYKLPDSSLYRNIQETIRERAGQGKTGVTPTDTRKYAERVVGHVRAGKTGIVWEGALSGMVHLMQHLPQTFMDSAMSKDSGLDRIKPPA